MDQEKEDNRYTGLEIAVIGMAGRFPGAKNLEEFWHNLKNGIESISFFTDGQLEEMKIDPALLNNPLYVRTNGGSLECKEEFDASFFDYVPGEVEFMNPQTRILHECAWEALENAGYNPGSYEGAIGLYAGASTSFFWEAAYHLGGKNETLGPFEAYLLIDREYLCSRVAYKLNLKGPAVLVQSACSTSLVAIDAALRGLITGVCDMALAGGISIKAKPQRGYLYQEGMILSPDGHCRAFDAAAKGMADGEGVGLVVLKLLEDAITGGDHIYAIIKGIAVNNDGNRKVGYTAPSVKGQVDVIRSAMQMADVEAESITYVETHGAGTEMGDPIEITALTQAFNTGKKGFCGIGSIKTNIGHLDAGAAVASFIKTVLALTHKQIPPSLNFNCPNPKIDFIDSPFYVNADLIPWENYDPQTPRRAGVSSLGIGGTNVHVILEEWPQNPFPAAGNRQVNPRIEEQPGSFRLYPVSARTPTALQRMKTNLEKYLADNPGIDPADVAFTLQTGRKAFPNRNLGVSYPPGKPVQWLSPQELNQESETQAAGKDIPPIILVLPGPGSFYRCRTLVREWNENLPCFREEMDHCLEEWKNVSGEDIRSSVFPGQEWEKENREEDGDTAIILDFIFQYAMAKLLMKLGVIPLALAGYYSGEYAAACLSGIFSLRQAFLWLGQRDEKDSSPHQLNLPKIPLISMAAGNGLTPEVAMDPGYWRFRKNLPDEKPVSWSRGEMQRLWEEKSAVLVEIDSSGYQKTFPQVNTATGKPFQKNAIHFSLNQSDPAVMQHLGPFLALIGRLWLYGVTIDWGCFYKGIKRSRVPLPTYPFEPYPYPINLNLFQVNTGKTGKESIASVRKKADITDWFYLPSWKHSPLLTQDNTPWPMSYWLIFLDEHGIGAGLVEILKAQSQEVITAAAGDRFIAVGEKAYILDPRQETHYRKLLDELSQKGMMPTRVVHMWSIHRQGNFDGEPLTEKSFKKEQYWGFCSLLFLAMAFVGKSFLDELQVIALSNYTVDVSGDDVLKPGKATIHAATKTISQEFPFIRCRCIDIVLPPPGTPREKRLLEKLSMELTCETFEPTAAYRGERRWIQEYESLPLGEALNPVPILRKKGIYLVIGGLGRIGNRLAAYLAGEYQARLVLVSRSQLPGKNQWNDWLSNHTPQDPTSQKILRISQLEKMGGEVLVLPADAASQEQMHQVINQAEEHFGPLDGVFHAAGETGDDIHCLIGQVDENHFHHQFRARVYGLMVLDQVLRGRKPGFCLVVSSLVSVLAGLGFAAYTAACIFMDSFIQVRNKTGDFPWISVNTAEWDFNPGEKRVSSLAAEMQQLSMTPEEGIETFKRILNHYREHQVVVSTADLRARINKWIKLESLREVSQAAPGGLRRTHSPVLHPRPNLSWPYEAPASPVQEALVEIWQNLFGYEPLGIHDDFFELGGDSLKAITALTLIHKELDVVVPLADFFNNSTIENLDLLIGPLRKSKYIPLEPAEKREYYLLSAAQQRLYLVNQMDPSSLSYNIPTVTTLAGDVDVQKLIRAFKTLVRRHESFMIAFLVVGETPVQVIREDLDFDILCHDLNSNPSTEEQEKNLIKKFVRPFDLSKPPLLRIELIKRNPAQYLLMMDFHHIITDVSSMTIFTREFFSLYKGDTLPLLKIQYKDYACWQNNLKKAGELLKQEEFWLKEFEREIPVLRLPTDFARQEIKSNEGDFIVFEVSPEETRALKELALEEKASIFMILLAVYNIFFAKLSGQEDILVGTSPGGRTHADLEPVIGFFINTLVLRLYPAQQKTFRQFLREVRKKTLMTLDNQDYQFEDLCEKVVKNRDPRRNPLFDVMFTMQNEKSSSDSIPGLTSATSSYNTVTSKFDLNLNGYEIAGKLSLNFEYCTKLFRESTIRVFINYFKKIVSAVVANPDIRISHIIMTSAEKKKEILLQQYQELENE